MCTSGGHSGGVHICGIFRRVQVLGTFRGVHFRCMFTRSYILEACRSVTSGDFSGVAQYAHLEDIQGRAMCTSGGHSGCACAQLGTLRGVQFAHFLGGTLRSVHEQFARLETFRGVQCAHLGTFRAVQCAHLGTFRAERFAHLGPFRGVQCAHLGDIQHIQKVFFLINI
jgi:hypothetical protein